MLGGSLRRRLLKLHNQNDPMTETKPRLFFRFATFVTLLVAYVPVVSSAQPSPQEIAGHALEAFYYPGDDMSVRVSMTLINSQGKERHRDMTLLRWNSDEEGDQRYFVYFHAPADVKGMTFMVWKYQSGNDDRWIFVPAVNMVRRIAANDKRSSFVGSDFTYEDLSGREVGDENHALLRTEELNGRTCFVLESRPVESADYARRVSWIDQERWIPLKEEYFDSRDQKVREFSADEVTEIGGHWTVTKRSMQNLQTGHSTEVTYSSVEYGIGLNKSLFTERYLRQPPRRWIR